VRAGVNLGIDIRIDEEYVPDMAQRLVVYRKVAAARSETEVSEVIDEIRDRYGPLPDSVLNLAAYGRIRVMADKLGIESIDRQGGAVVMKFRDSAQKASHAPDPTRVLAVLRRRPDVTLTPPASLRLNLTMPRGSAAMHAGSKDPASTRTEGPPTSRWSPGSQDTPTPPRSPGSSDPGSTSPQAARLAKPRRSSTASWWTARATAGTVTPGFTKEEILKPPKEDPRAEGGLFDRVAGLLEDLLR